MSRGFPSMTALLGLLAIAGYQNRDKIAEMLRDLGQKKPGADAQGGLGGWLGQLASGLGGASAGGILSGGLGELMERFKQSGQAETANSWVKTGPNKACTAAQLEKRDRPRGAGHPGETNGPVARRARHEALPRTPRRSRQVHAAGAASDGSGLFARITAAECHPDSTRRSAGGTIEVVRL